MTALPFPSRSADASSFADDVAELVDLARAHAEECRDARDGLDLLRSIFEPPSAEMRAALAEIAPAPGRLSR